MSENIDDYLKFIDSRGPDSKESEETVEKVVLKVKPCVWNPGKGKSTKMFVDVLKKYPLKSVKSVLDIGTGTGILPLLIWRKGIKNIIAVDNMDESLDCARNNFILNNAEKIILRKSDLFSNVNEKFDLIIFNAPATHPLRRNVPRNLMALWSPEENIRIRFLGSLKEHLTKNGRALLMYSKFEDFNPIPEKVLNKYPFSYSYLITSQGELSESGVIEIKLTSNGEN